MKDWKILKLLPVVLFIIARWVYDTFSPSIGDFAEIILIDDSPSITHWQIFYYIALNLAWILNLLYLRMNEYNDNYKTFYEILGISFVIDIVINLTKINMNFSEYVISIKCIEQNILISGFLSAIIIVFLFSLIKKRFKFNRK